jgi:hypothetical protein
MKILFLLTRYLPFVDAALHIYGVVSFSSFVPTEFIIAFPHRSSSAWRRRRDLSCVDQGEVMAGVDWAQHS